MKPTMEILEKINENSRNHPEEIFTRLYRYLLRPDSYYTAYKNLYANKGAGTKGVDNNDTADRFSQEKIDMIIQYTSCEIRQSGQNCRYQQSKKSEARNDACGCDSVQREYETF